VRRSREKAVRHLVDAARRNRELALRPELRRQVYRVLLALEPVARQHGENELDEGPRSVEGSPIRDQWRRIRAEIGPQQPRLLLHRVRGELDALERWLWLQRLVQAAARPVVEPAVAHAPQPVAFDAAMTEVGATMSAVAAKEPIAALVPIQRQLF